jgi:RNA polymerase sigma factor (sigma-70 family)
MKTTDDISTRLVQRAQAGDRAAWNELAERLHPLLLLRANTLAAAGRLAMDPADAVQEVLVLLFERQHDIRPESGKTAARWSAFGATALERFAQSAARKRATRREVRLVSESSSAPGPALPGREVPPEASLAARERAALLMQAFESLPERDRSVVGRRVFEDEGCASIARSLGLKPANVAKISNRALARLREACPGTLLDDFVN